MPIARAPRGTRSRAGAVVAAAVALLVALAACSGSPAPAPSRTTDRAPVLETFGLDPRVPVTPDVRYGSAPDGTPLLLDVCRPPSDRATSGAGGAVRPALLLVHGGSWEHGDKASVPYRSVCQWLARGTGYVVFDADYRLAPAHPFPAAIDDLRTAVTWMRSTAVARKWGIDPQRIGAVGGSAGGNLVSLLATEGSGSTDRGTRVAAVVDLSGPVLLNGQYPSPDLVPAELAYLDCTAEPCDRARAASPATWVDATDPPFLIANSTHEFIPLGQAEYLEAALTRVGVPATLIQVPGTRHSIAMLPGNARLQARILDFLHDHLGSTA